MHRLLDKYRGLPLAVKASLWFAFCSVLQKGISFITVPLFTRLLTTEEYGLFSLYLSWQSVIAIFVTLNLTYGVFNNGMIKYETDRDRYSSSMVGLSTAVTAIFFVIYLVAMPFWNDVFGLPTVVMLAMFAEFFATPALGFWSLRQRFEFKYRLLVIVTLVVAVLIPAVGLVAVKASVEKGIVRIVSAALVNVIAGLVFYVYLLFKGRTPFVKSYWRFALGFNVPLIPHYLSMVVLSNSDRILIEQYLGTTPVAIYSVAYSIATVMLIFVSSINSSFVPWVYLQCRDKNYSRIGKVSNYLVILVASIFLIPSIFAPEIVNFMAPSEYHAAVWAVPPVAASTFFIFVYTLFANIEFYFEESRLMAIVSCIGALANIGLNMILIPRFGFLAAAYTTLVCYVLFAIVHYRFMRMVCRKNNVNVRIFDRRFIALVSMALVVVSLLIMALYSYLIVRCILIVALLLAMYVKRNDIFAALKSLKEKQGETV